MTKYEKTCFKIVSIFVKKIYLCGSDFEKTVNYAVANFEHLIDVENVFNAKFKLFERNERK